MSVAMFAREARRWLRDRWRPAAVFAPEPALRSVAVPGTAIPPLIGSNIPIAKPPPGAVSTTMPSEFAPAFATSADSIVSMTTVRGNERDQAVRNSASEATKLMPIMRRVRPK